jgi:hypothetical protein
MMSHLSDDDLASYIEGDLRPRKIAKIRSHLAGCPSCQGRVAALEAVPNLLASVQYPPIPERLSNRIEMALAAESSARVASAPASEAGRRELPARARLGRHSRRAPRFTSPLALRAGAAVAAAVVIAGGGYALVSHTGSGSAPSSSSISGPSTSPAQAGPSVSYRHGAHEASIKTVKSGTNYKSATLASQAGRLITLQQSSASPGAMHANGSMSTLGASGVASSAARAAAPSASKLQGCVDRISGGKSVLLVDIAKYMGQNATIIVVGTSAKAEVYAVGSSCSSSASDILAKQSLVRT